MTDRLLTFGELRLTNQAGDLIAFPEKGLLLLCYLCANGPHEQSRASVSKLLWGDAETRVAYGNLRKTLSRILARQTELGRDYLVVSNTTIRLNEHLLDCDLKQIAVPMADALATLRHLVALMAQDFLVDLPAAGRPLQAWIDQQREQHRSMLRDALVAAADASEQTRDYNAIRMAALRILETDPRDEGVRSILVDLHGGQDDKSAGQETAKVVNAADIFAAGRTYPLIRTVPSEGDGAVAAMAPVSAARAVAPRLVLLQPATVGNASGVLANALIEDVTIGLCALRTVSVIAPYTAAKISLTSDKATIYERHAINYILDTRLSGDRSSQTLFCQLIHFANDEVIWADRFKLDGGGLLEARWEIARQIASAVSDQIEMHEVARAYFAQNPQAYRSYLLAERHLKNFTLPHVRRARKHLREALQASPHFAPALSSMARSFFLEWLLTARGDPDLLRRVEQNANAAIASDPTFASGYRELGVVKLYLRQFDESKEILNKAVSLSPHYANVIASYADTLVQASKPAEGLRRIEMGLELNPFCPDDYFWIAAGASYSIGQYEGALSYIARMKDTGPADRLSAASWAMLGNQKKARQFVQKTFSVHPDFELDTWMSIVPFREEWQKTHYRDGLKKAGF